MYFRLKRDKAPPEPLTNSVDVLLVWGALAALACLCDVMFQVVELWLLFVVDQGIKGPRADNKSLPEFDANFDFFQPQARPQPRINDKEISEIFVL